MGTLAWLLGIIATLCAVMGIITAAEIVPLLGDAFTVMFWLMLSAILFLACIAAAVSARGYE